MTPIGVIVHSAGVVEYANAAAARLLRAPSPQALVGLAVEALIHPEHRARFAERFASLGGEPGVLAPEERRILCRDGSAATFEVTAVQFRERGQLVVQSVLRDVSAERSVDGVALFHS